MECIFYVMLPLAKSKRDTTDMAWVTLMDTNDMFEWKASCNLQPGCHSKLSTAGMSIMQFYGHFKPARNPNYE